MSAIDISQYTLYAATPAQTRESRVRTHPQWGRGVPLADYLERDARLDTFEHAANGRLVTWVLVPRSDPQTLDFLCACETYRREGFVLLPGDGSAREETMFGIASVYTPPHHRRKGAAQHMMRLLHRVLAPPAALPPFPDAWGMPPPTDALPEDHKPGLASVLYSDVGAQFYSACGPTEAARGWELVNPVGTIWDVADVLRADEPGPSVAPIALGEQEALWERDSAMIRAELPSFAADAPVVTYAPWRGVGAFQAHRNAFFLESQGKTPLANWGARVTSSDELVYATWTMDVEVDLRTLIFTRIRCSDPTHFLALLQAAAQTASAHGLRCIEAWNLPKHLFRIAGTRGGLTEARFEHLPSLAWYGPGDTVRWLNNEKFVWC